MLLFWPRASVGCTLADADENVDADDTDEICELASSSPSPSSFDSLKMAAARAAAAADAALCGRWACGSVCAQCVYAKMAARETK
jgi:hypothetical protein